MKAGAGEADEDEGQDTGYAGGSEGVSSVQPSVQNHPASE